MAILSLVITIACFLFCVLGIHTDTHRILMTMLASVIIFVASSLAIPAVTLELIKGGPARDAQGELLKDGDGNYVFTQETMRYYQSTEAMMKSIVYLSVSIFGAGCLLLVFRLIRSIRRG